jgi:hypothetical protein
MHSACKHMHICTALLVHALVHALSFALVITLIASPAPPRLACLSHRLASPHWLKHSCASHAQCMYAHAHMHCLVGACSRACSELRSGHYTNRLACSASPCMSLAPHRLASLAEAFMCITCTVHMHCLVGACSRACSELRSGHCTNRLACSASPCMSLAPPRLASLAEAFMCITCTVHACTCTYALPCWCMLSCML